MGRRHNVMLESGTGFAFLSFIHGHKSVRHRKGPFFSVFCRFFIFYASYECLNTQVEGKIGSLNLLVITD
jgi:hypothetical protein